MKKLTFDLAQHISAFAKKLFFFFSHWMSEVGFGTLRRSESTCVSRISAWAQSARSQLWLHMHFFTYKKDKFAIFLHLWCIYILWPKFTGFCGGVDIMTHISTYPSSHMNKDLHGRPLLNQNVESVQSVYWESRDAIFNSCAPFFSISPSLFPLVVRQTHSYEECRHSS